MIIGNTGSQHRGECSWWAQGPRCLEQIQEWAQWVQHCHVSSDNEVSECVTFADGILCVKVEGVQQLLKMAMDNGNILIPETDEPSKVEPRVQVEPPRNAEEKQEHRSRKSCLFTECINSVLLCGAEPSLAGQWLPAADGDGTWADRTGSGPMLMRGDIFAASHGGGAGG